MISAEQLTSALRRAGVPLDVIIVFDESFELPAPDWITVDLAKAFTEFLFKAGITYRDGQFECNKFAKSASTIADWCWVKTRPSLSALAFGIFAYPGHMLCLAAHQSASGIYLAGYEPQGSVPEGEAYSQPVILKQLTITREEFEACEDCLFI